jgi:hypothetical protein
MPHSLTTPRTPNEHIAKTPPRTPIKKHGCRTQYTSPPPYCMHLKTPPYSADNLSDTNLIALHKKYCKLKRHFHKQRTRKNRIISKLKAENDKLREDVLAFASEYDNLKEYYSLKEERGVYLKILK